MDNSNIIIVLIVVLFIIVTVIITNRNNHQEMEGFSSLQPSLEQQITDYMTYPTGKQEGNQSEYRDVAPMNGHLNKDVSDQGLYRYNDYLSNMWDTRFPYLIDHRYSYDDRKEHRRVPGFDTGMEEELPTVPGKANLKELRLPLKNRWHAVIPSTVARSSILYWPDVIANQIVPPCMMNKNNCSAYQGCNELTVTANDCRQNRNRNSNRKCTMNSKPWLVDSPYAYHMLAKQISGRDPNDDMPASMADRSKESLEKLLQIGMEDERMSEPVHGWLPYEE